MAFSKSWEESYKANAHMSIWPWSDLVSYVERYVPNLDKSCKVLELGCGAGANIPFFQRLGVQYYGMDGSEFIVKKLWKMYPDHRDRIAIGDFTEEIPFDERFDVVVDRAALTHSTTSGIKKANKLIYDRMSHGGKFIGIDWFSTRHSDYKKGSKHEDEYTRTEFQDGQFARLGCVHFSDKNHLQELFASFKIRIMEHKILTREIPEDGHVFASWNFMAIKES